MKVWVMVLFIMSLRQGIGHGVKRQNKSNMASIGVNIFSMKCHQGPEVNQVIHESSGCGWSFAIACNDMEGIRDVVGFIGDEGSASCTYHFTNASLLGSQ